MTSYEALVQPFVEFAFMKRALAGCLVLSLGAAPIGVFLMLRRMSLTGDVMAHAILPGAAVGYLVAGLSLPAMAAGGLVAGLAVAVLSGLVSRFTPQREDASLAAFYLVSLAAGVTIVSTRGGGVDLLQMLFGSVLALDDAALVLIGTASSLTLVTFAAIYRPLVVECMDPGFLRSVSPGGPWVHMALLVLTVLNLVAGFQALGTLMVVGLVMLPAAAARFWARDLDRIIAAAVLGGALSSVAGLLVSYHWSLPSGPVIILTCGALYLASVVLGPADGLLSRLRPARHLEA